VWRAVPPWNSRSGRIAALELDGAELRLAADSLTATCCQCAPPEVEKRDRREADQRRRALVCDAPAPAQVEVLQVGE